jgi:very-short-patch-repair endonuclease
MVLTRRPPSSKRRFRLQRASHAALGLAIEYDGGTHRDSLASDNRRQNRLVDAGYRVLRFTAWDVLGSPDSVLDLVRRAIEGHEGLR